MTTQAHHLISQNVIASHELFRALRDRGVTFEGALLDLPDKASAAAAASASMAGDVADSAHQGRHYKAYDSMLNAYLDALAEQHGEVDGSGNYRLNDNIDDVIKDLRSLEVRLADLLTASANDNGRNVVEPEIILNASDSRIASGVVTREEAICPSSRHLAQIGAWISGVRASSGV